MKYLNEMNHKDFIKGNFMINNIFDVQNKSNNNPLNDKIIQYLIDEKTISLNRGRYCNQYTKIFELSANKTINEIYLIIDLVMATDNIPFLDQIQLDENQCELLIAYLKGDGTYNKIKSSQQFNL